MARARPTNVPPVGTAAARSSVLPALDTPMSRSVRGSVSIGRLTVSLPAQNAAAGQRVAERIGERLAERLPEGFDGHIHRLQVRVKPGRMDEEAIVSATVDALVASLKGR